MLSFVQQSQQGSVSTLDRCAVTTVPDNMVLQSFDLGLSCGGVDSMPPYTGDYAPSAASFYTELDSTIYSQGKATHSSKKHCHKRSNEREVQNNQRTKFVFRPFDKTIAIMHSWNWFWVHFRIELRRMQKSIVYQNAARLAFWVPSTDKSHAVRLGWKLYRHVIKYFVPTVRCWKWRFSLPTH